MSWSDVADRAVLLELIAAHDPSIWSGVAYRHSAPRFDPLSSEGARLAGGRWNPAGLFGAVYLAFPHEACLAEFRRMALAQGGSANAYLPRVFYTIEVEGLAIEDLREESRMAELGLDLQAILSPDRTGCQALAEAAYFGGREGILAPSATGEGFVLAVFQDRWEGKLRILDHVTVELE